MQSITLVKYNCWWGQLLRIRRDGRLKIISFKIKTKSFNFEGIIANFSQKSCKSSLADSQALGADQNWLPNGCFLAETDFGSISSYFLPRQKVKICKSDDEFRLFCYKKLANPGKACSTNFVTLSANISSKFLSSLFQSLSLSLCFWLRTE